MTPSEALTFAADKIAAAGHAALIQYAMRLARRGLSQAEIQEHVNK